jgi:hypothetical protein
VRQPEAPADDPAVTEETLDLVRMRVRPDVEILRPPPKNQVADAAADQIGNVTVLLEPLKDAERVRSMSRREIG